MCDEETPLSGSSMVVPGNTKDTESYPVPQGVVEHHAGNESSTGKAVEMTDGTSNYLQSNHVPGEKEMAFTVVAVDTDMSGQVQLSIIPTGSSDVSKLSANAVELSATDNPGLFNQLAFIATNMESTNPRCSTTEHQQQPVPENPVALQADAANQLDELTPEVLTQPISLSRTQSRRKQREDQGDKMSGKTSKKGRVRCSECDQDFSDLPSMRRHRLIHSNDKPYRCNYCEKAFRRRDNLREHVNIHTQEHVYTCEKCGKKFPRKYTHKMHMAKFCNKDRLAESGEKETEENWIASENNMVTSDGGNMTSKAMMVKSTTSGNAKNSDPCRICNKTFRDTSTLKRHMLTHSDERPFKCRQCDKSFRRKDHLMEHIIVHNVARPFTCLQCGKSFSRKNGLKTHMIRSAHKDGHEAQVSILSQLGINNCGEHVKDDSNFQLLLSPQNDDGTLPEASHNQQEGSTTQDLPDQMTGQPVNQAPLVTNINDGSATHVDDVSNKSSSDITNVPVVLHGGSSMEATLNENSVECPNCQHSFSGHEQLWLHFQEHLDNNQCACEFCFNIFANAEEVKDHQMTCIPHKNTNDVRANELLELGISTDMSSDGGKTDHQEYGDATKMLTMPCVKGQRTCEVCNKNFRDTTALKRHFLVHSGERPHACTRCDKRFRRRDHLKSHVTAYHCVTTTFQCKTCQMVFNTRYCLTTHIKTCQKSVPRLPSNSSDTTKISGTLESRTCPLCNKVFKDPSSQRRHMRVHSDERPFQCDLCTKSFRRKDNLKEHMLCHSNQKPFACEDCGKTLSRRSSLTNHRTICSKRGVDIHTANMTGQNATDVPNSDNVPLSDHLAAEQLNCENEIGPEEGGDLSQQSTIDRNTLRDVQLLQTSQTLLTTEPLPPATPLETISAETQLNQGVHHNDQPNIEAVNIMEGSQHVEEMCGDDGNGYACNLCGKIFRAKWTLKYHQRVHTGEKPYTCETCDRHFRQPSHLKIHQRTHSGERPYVCEACGRAFIDSSTMRRHMRTHKTDSNEQGESEENQTTNLSESQSDLDTQADQSASQKQDTMLVTDQSENTSIVHVMEEKTTEENEQAINQSENTNIIHMVEQLSNEGERVTNVQPGNTNIMHVVGELAANGGHQQQGDGSGEVVLTGDKLVSNIPGWQAGNIEQVTYYIVPTEQPKSPGGRNMSF